MKKIKTKSRKYPLIIILTDKTKITIPKQSEFSNQWLRNHGCSLMAEYVALQFLGLHMWPIHLLKWHKAHTPNDVKSKVTVKGVSKGIHQMAKGKGSAIYYKTPTVARIEFAMKAGHVVILEQKNPIHSIALIRDRGVTYKISYGTVTKVSVPAIAKTVTSNLTYRGMVVVKRK